MVRFICICYVFIVPTNKKGITWEIEYKPSMKQAYHLSAHFRTFKIDAFFYWISLVSHWHNDTRSRPDWWANSFSWHKSITCISVKSLKTRYNLCRAFPPGNTDTVTRPPGYESRAFIRTAPYLVVNELNWMGLLIKGTHLSHNVAITRHVHLVHPYYSK